MIAKEILKKHNLKAVPFSCIGEGETFNIDVDFYWDDYVTTTRIIRGGNVWFVNEKMNGRRCLNNDHDTVYVPVWRVT
jgi:hypothetical protein